VEESKEEVLLTFPTVLLLLLFKIKLQLRIMLKMFFHSLDDFDDVFVLCKIVILNLT